MTSCPPGAVLYLVAGGGEEPAGTEEERPDGVAVEAVLGLVVVGDAEARLVAADRAYGAAALGVGHLQPGIDSRTEVELQAEGALTL